MTKLLPYLLARFQYLDIINCMTKRMTRTEVNRGSNWRNISFFTCGLDPLLDIEPVKGHRDKFYVKLGDLRKRRRELVLEVTDGDSKCGPKTHITWELARNADTQAQTQTYPIRICILPRFPGNSYAY